MHVWPAVERAAGLGEAEVDSVERLGQIPEAEADLLRGFATALAGLRDRGTRLPLAELIDRAVTATGYDLAVLLKPAGEARFANVRKLMRIAEEYEAREGRDLRGLLDYLAFREEAADEASAATAAEDHDGVRIMSVHRAKGLEFEVVAVPHLDRSLLGGGWAPLLTFGRGEDRRVGMQLRRLGARSINLYDQDALRESDNERDAEEGLRLFHVAATRARRRLILSGVVKDKAGEAKPSTSGGRADRRRLRARPRGGLGDRGTAAPSPAPASMPTSTPRRSRSASTPPRPSAPPSWSPASRRRPSRATATISPPRSCAAARPSVPRRPALLLGDLELRGLRLPLPARTRLRLRP